MADENQEKTETDASKTQNSAKPTGALPVAGSAPVASPEHPPVSHIMPHAEVVPTDPVVVPQKPPVTRVMPPAPKTELVLTTPPPPKFENTPMSAPEPPAPVAVPIPHAADTEHDTLAEDVGLTIPNASSKVPSPMQRDIERVLESIKLPEKRTYAPAGEKKVRLPAPSSEKKLELILAAKITEQPAPRNPQSAPTMVPDQKVFHEDKEVASVHTLKQDLQHVVQEQKMSVVKAVALEQEKKSRIERDPVPVRAPSRAPAVIFTIAVFLLLGIGALGGVYYIAVLQSAPTQRVDNASLVFAEQTVPFPLTNDSAQSLRAQLALARSSSGTLGSLLHIIPVVTGVDAAGKETVRAATLSEFFEAIGTNAPENLMRALGDEFFLGIHTVDKNAPILVIKVNSYDRAFDGMLSWEKQMNSYLQPLFTPVPALVMGPDGLQIQRPFTDLVMRNYDVRALKDDDGVIQLYYSFPTRDLLVIAESPYTFTEILSRLQAGRRL